MKKIIEHVTLTTGHTRRSYRSEVDDQVIAALHDGLTLVAEVWRGADLLVTLAVAVRSTAGAAARRRLHAGRAELATSADHCPPEPWAAARIEIGLLSHLADSEWLGDWERCIAWTWWEHQNA